MSEKKDPETKALAKRDEVKDLTVRFPPEKYNVLAPVVHMPGGLPAGTRLVVTEIKVDPNPDNGEVFWLPKGQLLVGKTSLRKISNAAGVSWTSQERLDDGKHPHFCIVGVSGHVTDFDGTTRSIYGVESFDLREDAGSGIPGGHYQEIVDAAKAAKKGPRDPSGQLLQARKFMVMICASKAMNRAISDGIGMKRSYTASELAKTFIVPKIALDTSNPAARELAMANAAGATAALYGSRAAAPAPVVDAEFEEPAGDDGDEPPHDQETGEAREELPIDRDEEPASIVVGAWSRAKAAGVSAQDFRLLCEANSGRARKEDMTLDEARAVAKAVDGRIANSDDGDDGCPV